MANATGHSEKANSTPNAMNQKNQHQLPRRERRTQKHMAAKEARRQGKATEERDLQGESSASFVELPIREFQQNALPLLAFLAAIFVFYFPTLSGGFIWDDAIFSEEKTIQNWSGLWSIWFAPAEIAKEGHYWPLTYTTFWLDHKLFGLNPIGYHIVNCILYFINVVLIWRLLLKLEVPGAWVISMIFAIHPLHVEPVAWLIERKSLLSVLFYLGAIHVWLRFRESSSPKTYVLTLCLYALGLLSKSIVVTLPATLLILLWWKQERISVRDVMHVLPFFIVGFAITLGDYLFYISREELDFAYSFVERILIATQAVWFYVGKLLWPANLMVVYPRWDVSVENLIAWLFVAATVGVLILLWSCRHRIGKDPLAGVAFFIITLSPTLGFVDYGYMQYSFVADRYQYLAGLGLIAVLMGGAIHAMQPYITSFGSVTGGAFVVLVIGLGSLTWSQATIYQDEITFFRHIVSHNPIARGAYLNLGHALLQANRFEEGYEASLKAIELQPNDSKAHSYVAHALAQMGRYDESVESLKRALELDPTQKVLWKNYGTLQYELQRYEEAVVAFLKAIDLGADSALIRRDIANSYYGLGHHTKAMEWIGRARALTLAPSVQDELSKLSAKVLLALGKTEEAEQHLLQAVQGGDSDQEIRRLLELQKISTERGDADQASVYLQRILKLAEGNPEMLQGVAGALRQQEQYAKAIEIYQKILAIDPDFSMAYAGMGGAFLELERYEEAIKSLERSIELHPIPPLATTRLILMGLAASELGRPADATQYYERAVELDPRDTDALDLLASARFEDKRYEDALRLYKSMRDGNPEVARVHFNMGATLHHLGRFEEAIRSYETALSLDPSMGQVRFSLEQLKKQLEKQK